jgi:hypothetical protein
MAMKRSFPYFLSDSEADKAKLFDVVKEVINIVRSEQYEVPNFSAPVRHFVLHFH